MSDFKKNNKRGVAGRLEFTCDVERLDNGNTLITDAGDETGQGSEIIEVNPEGQIVWQYGNELKFAHSAKRLNNNNTLISDTTNNRVIIVDYEGKIIFNTDNWRDNTGKLSDGSHLHYPNDAHKLGNGNLLITDRNNNRCIITDLDGNLIWSYDCDIRHPHNCDIIDNGNILIADSDGNRVIEVNRDKEIIWEYGDGSRDMLNWPRDADRLNNGNTLITDSKNCRILEVTPKGEIAWAYKTPYFSNMYEADKLKNGNILISDQQHKRVFEIDYYGNIIWSFRNYRRLTPIYSKLKNGFFKKIKDNIPEGWIINTRLAEGGGKIIWDNKGKRPIPGLEYDRQGVLYLQQNVAVKPGNIYKMAGKIKIENMKENSLAYFQMAFIDEYGGLIEDAAEAPKGEVYVNDHDWIEDSFAARAPEEARAVELRIVISGKGRLWAKNIMFFS